MADAKDANLIISETFCADDAELVFRSSDEVYFKIHAANLKACTSGLYSQKGSTFDAVVDLSETSSTLELLFAFIYPVVQPDLQSIEFKALTDLADAAEKYKVFSAMSLCRYYMRKAVSKHGGPVFAYAIKYDYPEIIVAAAPYTVDLTFVQILSLIAPYPHHFMAWVIYRDNWHLVYKNALSHFPPKLYQADTAACMVECMSTLPGSLSTLRDLKRLIPLELEPEFDTWLKHVEATAALVSPFSKLEPPIDDEMLPVFDVPPDVPATSSARVSNLLRSQNERSLNEAEMVFISSDDQVFHVPEGHIQACSTGLLLSPKDSEPIRLPEISATLDLLFQFVYSIRNPDLGSVDFEILERLASAAEKYQVYPAMGLCRIHMKDVLPLHANAIFSYAAKGRYEDILNIAAPLCIATPMDIVANIPASMFVPWTKYQNFWNTITQDAICFYKGLAVKQWNDQSENCDCDYTLAAVEIICKLGGGVSALQDLDGTFDNPRYRCDVCSSSHDSWREYVEKAIQVVPEFSTFLGPPQYLLPLCN